MSSKLIENLNLLELVSTSNSFIEAVCPICGGSLKINNNSSSYYYGAYKCWTGDCSTKEIKKALGLNTFRSSTTESYIVFDTYIPPPIKVKPGKLCTVTSYQKPNQYLFSSLDTESPVTITYYNYTDKIRVKRIDNESGKFPILEVLIRGKWINKDVSEYLTLLPLYLNGVDLSSGDTIFMAEGEKTTDFINSLGFPCATPCNIGFDVSKLCLTLKSYYSSYIKNVLYIPDYDKAGDRKAKIVLHACWLTGIGAEALSLETLLPNMKLHKGADLADFETPLVKEVLIDYVTRYF